MSSFDPTLEREFALACLALYLQQHPDSASNLALNHYEER